MGRRFVIALSFSIFFLWTAGVEAAIYKYVDAQGQIHYSNVPVRSQYRFYQAEPGDNKHSNLSVPDLIQRYAVVNKLDVNLVRAVVRAESNFDVDAISSCGAIGLMQLHPETIQDLKVTDPFDPLQNIAGGTKYLRRMLDRFDGNLDLALAAYNAGPSTVERYGGIPPYAETEAYVEKVKHYRHLYRQDES
ncbi:MAG: lytic transglycosylase domain-containing protein [Desulfuromonas sp.]|nr:lytic transglycosylase domain-containing protein [Desulfuromonas sp.]